MDKEIEALERLKQEEVDIQLIFLKYLLDREFTRGRISEEYSLKYSVLSEDKKWQLIRALDKAYRCNPDAWTHDMGYVIDVMNSKFYENNE